MANNKELTPDQLKELEHLRQQIQMIFNLTNDYKSLLIKVGSDTHYQPMAEVTRYRLILQKKMLELEKYVTNKYYLNNKYY